MKTVKVWCVRCMCGENWLWSDVKEIKCDCGATLIRDGKSKCHAAAPGDYFSTPRPYKYPRIYKDDMLVGEEA